MGDLVYDAVLIGSGHNNLVAAVLLAEAGWKVLVLEAVDRFGGAVATDELTCPGLPHDSFSTFHVRFAASPFYAQWRSRLERHGLRYRTSPVQVAAVFPDGTGLALYRRLNRTVSALGRESRRDGAAWHELVRLYRRVAPELQAVTNRPIPSGSTALGAFGTRLKLGTQDTALLQQLTTSSLDAFTRRHFESEKSRAWFAGWAGQADHNPYTAGGAAVSWQYLALAQDPGTGVAVPEGGSGRLADALVAELRARGGEARAGAPVARVVIRGRTAYGVALADGSDIPARRAVIAGVAPGSLFGGLVPAELLPPGFARLVRGFRPGLPVFKLDLALDRPPEWRAGPAVAEATVVHVLPSLAHLGRVYQQAADGLLPDEPMLAVGQPAAADPTRTASGRTPLWVMVRSVPGRIVGDAAGRIAPGTWDQVKDRFADRIIGLLERYAPGLEAALAGRHLMSPVDLESRNVNLIGGDPLAGSMHLDQMGPFRPFPGWSRYRTPVRRLFLCGASTHPGAGVTGSSGYALARMLIGTI